MDELQEKITYYNTKINSLTAEIHQVVVGQDLMINRLLIGLFTNSHILLEGLPGLAKTLTINTLAKTLNLHFKRIQFTPDLLPADLIGTLIYNPKEAQFQLKKGPIFTNLLLADEINRAPAKVQSALLEAMQEKQVTIGETTHPLTHPFLVLATQNPIDQEGTYPLPEAQIDRFLMKITLTYPSRQEELQIMQNHSQTTTPPTIKQHLNPNDILQIQQLINQIEISERLQHYIIDLVHATRNPDQYKLPKLKSYIQFGASPRASIAMNIAARATALLNGRTYTLPQDIKEIAPHILNHRLILTYEAQGENITPHNCIEQILKTIPI